VLTDVSKEDIQSAIHFTALIEQGRNSNESSTVNATNIQNFVTGTVDKGSEQARRVHALKRCRKATDKSPRSRKRARLEPPPNRLESSPADPPVEIEAIPCYTHDIRTGSQSMGEGCVNQQQGCDVPDSSESQYCLRPDSIVITLYI
jgi:hypothetical protein